MRQPPSSLAEAACAILLAADHAAGRLVAGPEATSRRTPCWGWPEGKENLFARSRGLLEGEVCLLLHHTTSALGVLATHGPRAFGGAFAVGLDGIDLVVI